MTRLLRLGSAAAAVAVWATGCAANAPLGSGTDHDKSAGGASSVDPEGTGGAKADAAAPRGSGGVTQGETPGSGGLGTGGMAVVYCPPGTHKGFVAGEVRCLPCDGVACTAIGCGTGTHSVMVPGQCCPVCESCAEVPCDAVACADGNQPFTPPGECCPSTCVPVSSPTACNDGSGRTDCCPPGFDIGTPCGVEDGSCLSPCKNGVRVRRICMAGFFRLGEETSCNP